MRPPVVLIHGAFAGPWCMENFAAFLQDRGWTCHRPALRYHCGDPKADANPALAKTSIEDYTRDLATFVRKLDARPIILGHAIGAVIAQKLAAQGLAQGIVLINSNVPWGVLPSTDDERAVAKGLIEAGAFWNTAMRVEFDLIAPYAFKSSIHRNSMRCSTGSVRNPARRSSRCSFGCSTTGAPWRSISTRSIVPCSCCQAPRIEPSRLSRRARSLKNTARGPSSMRYRATRISCFSSLDGRRSPRLAPSGCPA